MAYLTILVQEDYFHEKYYVWNEFNNCDDINTYKLEQTMKVELGFSVDINRNYSNSSNRLTSNEILDTIEFFFRQISIPIWEYDMNERYVNSYDEAKARYDYTCKVNAMFKRQRLAYKLEKGSLEKIHSGVLDSVLKLETLTSSQELRYEAMQAVRLFKSRNSADVKSALTTIANAFEHAKTLMYPDNKKESIKAILKKATGDNEKMNDVINKHFIYLTELSNNVDIRHKESGVIILDDEDMQQYLFYTYYNAIRLITKQLDDRPPF
jgi:hypothetical protein